MKMENNSLPAQAMKDCGEQSEVEVTDAGNLNVVIAARGLEHIKVSADHRDGHRPGFA